MSKGWNLHLKSYSSTALLKWLCLAALLEYLWNADDYSSQKCCWVVQPSLSSTHLYRKTIFNNVPKIKTKEQVPIKNSQHNQGPMGL